MRPNRFFRCGKSPPFGPSSLDGGITSALQEDIFTHATPAADKALAIIANLGTVIAIEVTAAAQAYEIPPTVSGKAAGTAALHEQVRRIVPVYHDDRPLNALIKTVYDFIHSSTPRP